MGMATVGNKQTRFVTLTPRAKRFEVLLGQFFADFD